MAEKSSMPKRPKKSVQGFTEAELAAMRERAKELRARRKPGKLDGEQEVLAKIAEMQASDRTMAKRIHGIIRTTAPTLVPRTWYGMPAYSKDGEVLCFFRPAEKFGTRYATLGFSDGANLDEGHMWPTDFALKEVTSAEETQIVALVKKAIA